MRLLYRFFLWLYGFLIRLASPFNPKAAQWLEGRRNWREKVVGKVHPEQPTAWFHCASVGEFEQARPVIESFRRQYPDWTVVLTFFSPSGFNLRKNYAGADLVAYLPVDSPQNAADWLDLIQPRIVFFVKYEFWYFYLTAIQSRRIPLYLISGIFRPGQWFFRSNGQFFRKMLGCFSHFFVQNPESVQLLAQIGFHNCTLTGDTRFDRVLEIASQAKEIPLIQHFAEDSLVLMGGSTWPPDEDLIFAFLSTTSIPVKVVMAPHEVSPAHLARFKRFHRWPTAYFSQTTPAEARAARVLIIDCIGLLSSAYRYARVAHVGGAFRTGLHNILEPAVYGIPVVFGPHHAKFAEAAYLIARGGAWSVGGEREYLERMNTFFSDDRYRSLAGQKAGEAIAEQQGATRRILDFLQSTGL